MSLVVECGCGARFRAKDELSGKSLPCPKCGQVLTIPSAATPVAAVASSGGHAPAPAKPPAPPLRPPPAGRGTVFPGYPTAGRAAQKPPEPSRFAISGRAALYISLFVIVPIILYLIKIGPVNAMSKWQAEEDQIETDMTDIVNRFLVTHAEKQGASFEKARDLPHLTSLVVDAPIMMITFPETVAFQGRSTEGHYWGTFYTKDRSAKIKIEVDDETFNITGRCKDGGVTFDKYQ